MLATPAEPREDDAGRDCWNVQDLGPGQCYSFKVPFILSTITSSEEAKDKWQTIQEESKKKKIHVAVRGLPWKRVKWDYRHHHLSGLLTVVGAANPEDVGTYVLKVIDLAIESGIPDTAFVMPEQWVHFKNKSFEKMPKPVLPPARCKALKPTITFVTFGARFLSKWQGFDELDPYQQELIQDR